MATNTQPIPTPDGSGAGLHPVVDGWEQEKQVVRVDAPEPYDHHSAGLIPVITPQTTLLNVHELGERDFNQNHKGPESVHVFPEKGDSQGSWFRRNRRKIIITSAVALVCIIAAALVGAVLGSRKNSESQSSSSSNGTPDNTTTTTEGPKPTINPTLIRPNSRLSAAGWRGAEGRFNIRLFYQGNDDLVRYSSFSSNFNWSQPTVAGLEAISGSSLAACANIHVDPPIMNLFYLDKSSRLKAHNFIQTDTAPQAGSPDNTVPSFDPLPAARLSCYMPFVLAQESTSNHLKQFNWDANYNSSTDKAAWYDFTNNMTINNVLGSSGSSVVMLPIKSQYYAAGGFMYRRSDGTLASYALDGRGDPKGTAWDTATPLSVPDIPPKSSIAAFTVARSPSTESTDENTYILYQDKNGVIQVVWQDDVTSGWKGPETASPALDGADMGTNITCVTQQAWDAADVWLKTVSPINRCYFQSQGAVKEVVFDGKGWQDLGFVPID